MKMDFSKFDMEQFSTKDGLFCGHDAVLVTPCNMGCDWTQQNKIFRSSVWSMDGVLLSAGFPKFVNWGENPEVFPVPTSIKDTHIIDKIDGSLCICDYVNETFSMRTRGTLTYETLDNAHDFKYCMEKYPKILEYLHVHYDVSLLFEITTPNQRIVLNYGDEVELTLVGAVDKNDYYLIDQDTLDEIALKIDVKRPIRHSASNLAELIDGIKKTHGIEGCCLYSGNGQVIHKIKSEQYLKLHFLRTSLNDNKLIELISYMGYPHKRDFRVYIETEFDYECWQHIEHRVDAVYDAMLEIHEKIWEYWGVVIEEFDDPHNANRGDVARFIMKHVDGKYTFAMFKRLDGVNDIDKDPRGNIWMVNMIKEMISDV